MNASRKQILWFFLGLTASSAVAALEPNRLHEALPKKTESYFSEGVITGGDRDIHGVIVKDLRRATNAGFERVVLDLESEKPPYYQVSIEPKERRVLVTLFGNPHLGLNAKKIVDGFKKSPLISKVEFFPKVEDETFIFTLYLKNAVPVEVFELSAPSRVIFDLKTPVAVNRVQLKKAKAPETPESERSGAFEGNGAAIQSDDIPE